ncbi:MAG: hypothetical protein K2K26_01715 [Muribaculaceae bacterium]|nr:hypothetical protein [Muribaculaceae bacterium]
MEKIILIPAGRMSADDAALAAKRAALKAKLLSGDKITLKSGTGNAVQGSDANNSISIPKGKLAVDDVALKAKREALKKKLMNGEKITLKGDGNVTGTSNAQNTTISIPKGKLAAQWYETNPTLLQAEKAAMAKCFPGFKLGKLDDGRLYWLGELTPGVYETKFGCKKSYYVMAVYQNNHPNQQMGSSVYVYLVQPDVEDIVRECGFHPSHLLRDTVGEVYLCTTEAGFVQTGNTVTTAASVLAWAVKWLLAYELVLTGDLPKEKFNEHHGI